MPLPRELYIQDRTSRCDALGNPLTVLLLREASHNVGGIERGVLAFGQLLQAASGIDPVFATTDLQSDFGRRIQESGIPCEEVPLRGNPLRALLAVRRVIKRNAVDVVQPHGEWESFVARCASATMARRPFHLCRVHTYIDSSNIPAWRKWVYHTVDRLTSPGVDVYACITFAVARELSERSQIPPHKIAVLPNVANVATASPETVLASCQPLLPTVALVANFVPGKGHTVLFAALDLLRQKGVTVRARLLGSAMTSAGGDTFENELRENVRARGIDAAVSFDGFTDDIAAALQGVDVLVLPSDSEGLPVSILEAFALRKLVIASRVGGIPEAVRHGENGLLHEPGDPTALADLLEDVFSTPSARWAPMRHAGFETWNARYSPAVVGDRLLAMMNAVPGR